MTEWVLPFLSFLGGILGMWVLDRYKSKAEMSELEKAELRDSLLLDKFTEELKHEADVDFVLRVDAIFQRLRKRQDDEVGKR